MKPTLLPGDTLFVKKWPYSQKKGPLPQRGEIVIFTDPSNPDLNYIKRVVGLPGDQIAIEKGHVILNGKDLFSDFPAREISPEGKTWKVVVDQPLMDDLPTQKVPSDSVLALGDFRSKASGKKKNSLCVVPVSSIQGKASWIWLSIDSDPFFEKSLFPHFRWSRMFKRID